jgi:hypothetical protein
VWLVGNRVFEDLDEPGFANPCLTTQQHDLPLSLFHLVPSLSKQSNLLFTTNERRQPSWRSDLKSALRTTFTKDTIDGYGLSHSSQRVFAQCLALEVASHKAVRRGGDDDRIRLCQPLETGSHIGNFPQCQLFLSPCPTHFTDHHQSSMNAQTDNKVETLLSLQTSIEVSHGSKNSQTSPYCSLRIVFMRLRIPKVHQESIP